MLKKKSIFLFIFAFVFICNLVYSQDLNLLLDSSSEASISSNIAPQKVDEANTNNITTTTNNSLDNIISKVKFKTADDKIEALVIKEHNDHDNIEVNIDGFVFVMKARMNKPGVRKYKELAGLEEKSLIAEVKIKDDSFKLVDENNKLLWKVKISSDKVKISDNEDNKNPFVLKKSDDKVKVKDQNEKEIAKVKFYKDNGKLKLKDKDGKELFISKDYNSLSGAIGVLAIKDIPAKYRTIIVTELVKIGF